MIFFGVLSVLFNDSVVFCIASGESSASFPCLIFKRLTSLPKKNFYRLCIIFNSLIFTRIAQNVPTIIIKITQKCFCVASCEWFDEKIIRSCRKL